MKKILVFALSLSMFLLCSCQGEPHTMAYDGPYVDLIAADAPDLGNGEISITKVDIETGYPVAGIITLKNGDETVQERVFPRFDHEGTERPSSVSRTAS